LRSWQIQGLALLFLPQLLALLSVSSSSIGPGD
jgi:hypothetical protein